MSRPQRGKSWRLQGNARLALPDGGGDGAAVAEIGALGRRLGISRLQGLGEGGDTWVPPAPTPLATSQSEEDSLGPGPRPDGEWEGDKAETQALDSQPSLPRRPFPCPRCGKSFIHPKRLQTHEVQCRRGSNTRGSAGLGAAGSGPGGPAGVDASALPQPVGFRDGPEHVVKVVGGHVLYVCAACERSYVTLSSLKRHSNVHSWRRKYPCRYCEKVFALAEYRTKHEITVRIGEEAIVKRRISETDLRPGELSGEEIEESEEEEEEEEDQEESKAGGEDQLWRPYYSYKPKRKAGATAGGVGGVSGPPRGRRPPRWRQKLERRAWEETPSVEGPGGRGRGERRHRCGDCAQTFATLRKLRKHQEAHSGGSHSSRTGKRSSSRFPCPHCAKVCKAAAALSRHVQRHAVERPGGTPTPVIAYSKGSVGPRPSDVKEEAPQEMQVSSSSGEAGGGGGGAAAEAPETASLQDPVISGGEEPPGAGGGSYVYPPVQEFPLALIGGSREPSGGRGKAGNEGLVGASDGERMEGMGTAKVTFYPEPYPLVYGPQLLAAYPYNFSNLAALPVALNMVLPDEKGGGALPFLPGVFGYAVNPQAAPPTPPTPPPPTLSLPVPPKGVGEQAGVERTQKGDVG
ncbi:zinc finger and BTB domain containing 4 [Cricetulus griseus]